MLARQRSPARPRALPDDPLPQDPIYLSSQRHLEDSTCRTTPRGGHSIPGQKRHRTHHPLSSFRDGVCRLCPLENTRVIRPCRSPRQQHGSRRNLALNSSTPTLRGTQYLPAKLRLPAQDLFVQQELIRMNSFDCLAVPRENFPMFREYVFLL